MLKSGISVILVTLYQGIIGIPLALVCSFFTADQMLISKDIVSIDAYYWLGLFGSGFIIVISIFGAAISIQIIGPVLQNSIRTSGLITAYIIQIIVFNQIKFN